MSSLRLPLQDIVDARSSELGVSRSELAHRCGYKNKPKGIRRIEELFAGNLQSPSAKMILDALPSALKVDKEIIDCAVRESVDVLGEEKGRIAAEQDAKRRASFKSEAFLIGTESRPSQIVLYGVTGGPERWLKIPLDLSNPPVTYAMQALAFVRKTSLVPFHGKTIGFVINYTPNNAVRFDKSGDPIEVFSEAYVPGQVQIEMGNRRIVQTMLARLGLSL